MQIPTYGEQSIEMRIALHNFFLLLVLLAVSSCLSVPKLKCPAEESNGYKWPEKAIGESSVQYCNGIGYYRRICLYKNTSSGPSAVWSSLVNMCKCKGDDTWKETPAGQYAYIDCPGAYEGYIGRFCTPEGDWGLIKDLCYLPDGRNVDEYEVEL
ncbi:hypothetical protein WA171_003434 [Blastocystis sp. BT1]